MPFLTSFGAWAMTLVGRCVLSGLAIGGAWLWVKLHYESAGRVKERAKIERAGDLNAQKSEAARRSVDRLPDSRLRDGYFRD